MPDGCNGRQRWFDGYFMKVINTLVLTTSCIGKGRTQQWVVIFLQLFSKDTNRFTGIQTLALTALEMNGWNMTDYKPFL